MAQCHTTIQKITQLHQYGLTTAAKHSLNKENGNNGKINKTTPSITKYNFVIFIGIHTLLFKILKLFSYLFIFTFFTFLIYSEVDSENCNNVFLDKNSHFFKYINSMSEANRQRFLEENNLFGTVKWNDPNLGMPKYMPMENKLAVTIFENPNAYICYTAYVVESDQYDQSQKAYAIMLMHFSSIKNQIYLLKTANKAYENGIITDKKVLAELLYSPELKGQSTNSKYTWLPAWRREFQKHASDVLSQEEREEVLLGKTLLWDDYP